MEKHDDFDQIKLRPEEENSSRGFRLGVILSLIYIAFIVIIPLSSYFISWSDNRGATWEGFGQWLGGALVPIAISWGIVGFRVQSNQLRLQKEQLQGQEKQIAEQSKELQQTRDIFIEQLKEQAALVKEMIRTNDMREKHHFDQMIPIHEKYLDQLAKSFIIKEGDIPSEIGLNGFISLVKVRLDACDWEYRSLENQKRIYKIDTDPEYQRFCFEFRKFWRQVEGFDLAHHVSAELHNFLGTLNTFEGYSRLQTIRG